MRLALTLPASPVRFELAVGYSIRNAVASDYGALVAFLDEFLRRDYFIRRRQLQEILGGRYHEALLAVDDERILGVAITTRRLRTLVNLLVRPCERKRGIADALLFRLRVERIRVKTNVSDGDPTGYYLKRGYRMSPERTGKPHIRIAVVDLDSPPNWTRFATNG